MTKPEAEKELKILTEESIYYEGLQLHYLFAQNPRDRQFCILAECGGSSAMAALGSDPAFAANCYRAMRDGGVTPCTLEEVAADLRAANGNFAAPLYKS